VVGWGRGGGGERRKDAEKRCGNDLFCFLAKVLEEEEVGGAGGGGGGGAGGVGGVGGGVGGGPTVT